MNKICEIKIYEYIKKRGDGIFDHRKLSNKIIPGSLRYEVLKNQKESVSYVGLIERQEV